jgi:hypothetical protein
MYVNVAITQISRAQSRENTGDKNPMNVYLKEAESMSNNKSLTKFFVAAAIFFIS